MAFLAGVLVLLASDLTNPSLTLNLDQVKFPLSIPVLKKYFGQPNSIFSSVPLCVKFLRCQEHEIIVRTL